VVRFTNGSGGEVPGKTAMIREENDDDNNNKILFSVMFVLMV
jgi:hypothetical protein